MKTSKKDMQSFTKCELEESYEPFSAFSCREEGYARNLNKHSYLHEAMHLKYKKKLANESKLSVKEKTSETLFSTKNPAHCCAFYRT